MRPPVVIGLLVALISLGLLAWWAVSGNDSCAPGIVSKDQAPDGTGPAPERNVGTRRDGDPTGQVTPADHGKTDDHAPAHRENARVSTGPGVAGPFIATRLASKTVAVNISGGQSGLTVFGSPGSEDGGAGDSDTLGGCQLHGLVSDSQGRVAGAVVLAGRRLYNAFGNVVGSSGTNSDERGWFELPVACGQITQVVAMHHQRGWSRPRAVSAQQGSTRVDIDLERAGRMEGKVTRGGLPERADLRLVAEGGVLELGAKSDATGIYQFASVPPGVYELVCGITVGAGGNVPSFERVRVEIPSGKVVHQDIELGDGTLVVVHLERSRTGDAEPMLTVALLGREQASSSVEEVLAYLDTKAGRRSHQVLIGGRSVDVPIQFHNVDPGNYRLCVVSMNETPPRLVCQPLSVHDYQSVVEASVEI